MLHLRKLQELGTDLFGGPTLGRKRRVARHARPRGHEFAFEVAHGVGDLGGDSCPDARQAEKDAVEVAARGIIGEGNGTEEAVAAELEEGFSGPAEEKEDEDEVAKTGYKIWLT